MTSYSATYEYGGFASRSRISYAVRRLILLNTALFALQMVLVLAWPFMLIETTWLSFVPDLLLRGHVWRLVTYMFLHVGLSHLFSNMLWLFVFGPEVERVLGTRQFVRFYLICGALGVLATFPADAITGTPSAVLGASGATMGVLMAFAMIDPERELALFPIPMRLTARGLVIVVIIWELISSLRHENASIATHLGGLAVGYVYMKLAPRILGWWSLRTWATLGPKTRRKQKNEDKLGEAVDNILRFKSRKGRRD